MPLRSLAVFLISLLTAAPVVAGTTPVTPDPNYLQALERMMRSLAYDSARAAIAIRDSYDDHLELLYLREYEAMEGALATGGLVPLPLGPRFNLRPRLDGPHPIGEKDLTNQNSYLAARPFTIGCLLDIASRVQSGPVEITSLVRHGEYQDALLRTNPNARTAVPTHTMGLAFDIALVNSSMETAIEIRDVLLDMRDAGDLLFIGERNQLVFHVVPHPSRLGFFMERYNDAVNASAIEQALFVPVVVPGQAQPAPPRRTPIDASVAVLLLGAAFPAMVVALVIGRNGRARPWKGCCTPHLHEADPLRDGMRDRPLDSPHASSTGA